MDDPIAMPSTKVSYARFQDDSVPLTEDDMPLRPENRKTTDKAFSFVLSSVILIAIVLLATISILSTQGNDDRPRSVFLSSTEDTMLWEDRDETTTKILNPEQRTIDATFFAWRLALVAFISLGLTTLMTVMYRYATAVTVWGILILSWLYYLALTVALWYWDAGNAYQMAVSITVVVVLLLVLIFMKDRVQLVVMLFKETTKATFDMQAVFSVPAVTMLLMLVILAIYIPATYFIATAGLTTENTYEEYIPRDFRIGVVIFNTIAAGWLCEFILGVQYMIVSGAITKWYYTKNKAILGTPVYTSFYVALRYHLGTAALGSLIVTIVAVIRTIFRMLARSRLRLFVICCLDYFEYFVKFFTRSAYIVTAMHGTSFIESGKLAVEILNLNVCNVIGINSLGDFVLAMTGFLVIGLSVGITYLISVAGDIDSEYTLFYFIFAVAVSTFCCLTVLSTFETSFSTLFLCVCQDFLINNGNDKPYSMTRDMMEYLDESKKVFCKKIEKENLPKI